MRSLSADGRRQVGALTNRLQQGPQGSVLSSAYVPERSILCTTVTW
jgi:hypothetical protein